MERVLALWFPGRSSEGTTGSELRELQHALEVVAVHCPFVEPLRLGLLALPARAPSRFYGGERAVATLLGDLLDDAGLGPVRIGVSEGLFASVLAARDEIIVSAAETSAFLATQPISVLRRSELASLCQRLGLSTLGRFAALDEGRVLERFGTDGVHCHRVARGSEGELVGLRDLTISARLALLDEPPPPPVQPSFFGGSSLAAERAAKAAIRLQHQLGTAAVSVARLRCGHDPGERAELVPFGAPEGRAVSSDPWPGSLPAPSPAAVLTKPLGCRLTDAQGAPVEVTTRGLLNARPARCTVEGEPRTLAVTAWAGPWPVSARWWERRAARARLQVVTEEGVGLLLSSERGAWQLVGRYD